MIQITNNDGGTVIINEQPPKPKRKNWLKKWHAFGLTFAIANCRIKKRDWRDTERQYGETACNNVRDIKRKAYEKQDGKCPMCGNHFEYKEMENHHVLPWGRFPEYRMKAKNMLFVCHKCHREIHNNPWLNIRLMKEKADELGIDLHDKYDYGEEDIKRGCEDNPTTTD
jgi:hypothetical protein